MFDPKGSPMGGFGGFGPGRPGPSPTGGGGLFLYLPGALFAGLGLAILLIPELFRYLVAAVCLAIGAVLLLAASQLRRARRQQQRRSMAENLFGFFRPDDRG